MKDLKATYIQQLYSRMVMQQVGVPTIQKIHKLLHSSLETAEKIGIITRIPFTYARPPREPLTEMKILARDQV